MPPNPYYCRRAIKTSTGIGIDTLSYSLRREDDGLFFLLLLMSSKSLISKEKNKLTILLQLQNNDKFSKPIFAKVLIKDWE